MENSTKNIEETITRAFQDYSIPVTQTDWDKIKDRMNGDFGQMEDAVSNVFQGFEMPLDNSKNIWGNILNEANVADIATETNIQQTFSNYETPTRISDWVGIKLGLWMGPARHWIAPALLIAGIFILSVSAYQHLKPVANTENYKKVVPADKQIQNKPLVQTEKQAIAEVDHSTRKQSDQTIPAQNSSAEKNKTDIVLSKGSKQPVASTEKSVTSGEGLPKIKVDEIVENKYKEMEKVEMQEAASKMSFSKLLGFEHSLFAYNETTSNQPVLQSAKPFVLKSAASIKPVRDFYYSIGIGTNIWKTAVGKENPIFRGTPIQTRTTASQYKLQLEFGKEFVFGTSSIQTGLGIDATLADPYSAQNPYSRSYKLVVVQWLPYLNSNNDTLYLFPRKWDTVWMNQKHMPKASWVQVPIWWNQQLFKVKNQSLSLGLGLYPGVRVAASGQLTNPYLNQHSTYWNYFYKTDPINVKDDFLAAADYMKKTRLGAGVNLRYKTGGKYLWTAVDIGYLRMGNPWKTSNVFPLQQQMNQFNVKLSTGIKF